MSMTSESEERMIVPNSGVDSPSTDEANSLANVGNNVPLKKALGLLPKMQFQKHSGLSRCGKSCRLRWANHLRPDLKKGAFTPDEERRIIELHAKMGNKWARMAAEVYLAAQITRSRTTGTLESKDVQRAGLPIYPPDICLQAMNENQQSDNMNSFSSRDVPMPPVNNIPFPSVEFKGLELNQPLYPQPLIDIPSNSLLDIPMSSLLAQGFRPSYQNKSLISTIHPPKRLRGSESLFPGSNTPISNLFTNGSQYQSDYLTSSSFFSGSQAILNGNPSSEPGWAMKLELPSLQTQTGTTWGSPSPSSPLPVFESVDILIQTPPTELTQSPQNSGLLEEVLYESETIKNSNSNSFQQSSRAPNMANDVMENSARVLNETKWDAYDEEVSPLGHSSSSVFSESTPISGNSLDEPHFAEALPVKEEASDLCPMQYDDKVETTNQMILSRPDLLLASNCLAPMKHPTNVMGTFLGDDWSRDCKQMDTGSTSSAQGRGRNSCAWNAMPTV
ncbi:hypothetical protein DH2020_020950 [Rehmannia glutinosa]|uniref:R2R3-MYB protein n=1 Tax=Rehmannia glutinosa TaxID=99300 RepID=A0ABR0WD82_REHGL